MRVVSLLPSATESLCLLGAGPHLVGRSHECDYPDSVRTLPVLTAARTAFSTSAGVDAAVSQALAAGQSLYHLDEPRLRELAPDLIVTQDLCRVCSIDLAAVQRVAASMATAAGRPVRVVSLNPTTIEAVFDDLMTLGEALDEVASLPADTAGSHGSTHADARTNPRDFGLRPSPLPFRGAGEVAESARPEGGREGASRPGALAAAFENPHHSATLPLRHYASSARHAVLALRERMFRASDYVNSFAARPRVAMLEWTDPLFIGGHWTPQLIERAGAEHPLNPTQPMPGAGAGAGGHMAHRTAGPSRRITPQELIEAQPEHIVIAPCGLDLERTRDEARALLDAPWFRALPACANGRVALVDGNQMFNRPGPRLIDALEWLIGWLNDRPEVMPEGFPWMAA